jgi:hypothetical protein
LKLRYAFVSHNLLKEKVIFFPVFFKEIESSLNVHMEIEESGIAGGGAILLNQEQYFLGCQGNRVQLWQQ